MLIKEPDCESKPSDVNLTYVAVSHWFPLLLVKNLPCTKGIGSYYMATPQDLFSVDFAVSFAKVRKNHFDWLKICCTPSKWCTTFYQPIRTHSHFEWCTTFYQPIRTHSHFEWCTTFYQPIRTQSNCERVVHSFLSANHRNGHII